MAEWQLHTQDKDQSDELPMCMIREGRLTNTSIPHASGKDKVVLVQIVLQERALVRFQSHQLRAQRVAVPFRSVCVLFRLVCPLPLTDLVCDTFGCEKVQLLFQRHVVTLSD